jgi:hypothetical protein
MRARWTVHQQRRAFNVGVPEMQRLRFASEGGAVIHRGRGAIARWFEAALGPCRSNRPESWLPYVFTSTEEAAEAGVL